MLILLKLACFGLWLAMMIRLILMQPEDQSRTLLTLRLADPQMAEYEIKSVLSRMMPAEQLCLTISCRQPDWAELFSIASCLQRANPSIVISADAEMY
jgi:hypothetical protein